MSGNSLDVISRSRSRERPQGKKYLMVQRSPFLDYSDLGGISQSNFFLAKRDPSLVSNKKGNRPDGQFSIGSKKRTISKDNSIPVIENLRLNNPPLRKASTKKESKSKHLTEMLKNNFSAEKINY
jgi:hypothetical protein